MRSDDLIKGAALGIGVALLVPVAMVALAPVLKPLARSALKTGMLAYEKGREAVEELGETLDDVRAEVEEELMQAHTEDIGEDAPQSTEDMAESANPESLH